MMLMLIRKAFFDQTVLYWNILTINKFFKSDQFLKILLFYKIDSNSDFLEYQKLAANLFRKFCEKEASNQSTANYNINYDTFVCQFSSMCYNNNRDEGARAEIRSSGLQCLATMVKRLVPDESLRAGFLWDNMDKIVPALLFIMHESYLQGSNSAPNEYDENLHDDDIELDHTLDRYLYGDFFIHSRTNNCLNKPDGENENQASGDLDAVKIELNNKSNSAQDGERIMMSSKLITSQSIKISRK